MIGGGIGSSLAVAAVDEDGAAAGAAAGLDVPPAVADHVAGRQVDARGPRPPRAGGRGWACGVGSRRRPRSRRGSRRSASRPGGGRSSPRRPRGAGCRGRRRAGWWPRSAGSRRRGAVRSGLGDAREDLELLRAVAGGIRAAVADHGALSTPSRSRKTARAAGPRSSTDSHFVCVRLEPRVRDEQVPDDGLERLGVRRDVGGVDGRHDDAGVGHLGGVAAVPADDADDRRADLLGVLQGVTRFGLTFFSRLPPPTESTKIRSSGLSRLRRSHSTKTVAQPSSLVRAVSSETLSVGA